MTDTIEAAAQDLFTLLKACRIVVRERYAGWRTHEDQPRLRKALEAARETTVPEARALADACFNHWVGRIVYVCPESGALWPPQIDPADALDAECDRAAAVVLAEEWWSARPLGRALPDPSFDEDHLAQLAADTAEYLEWVDHCRRSLPRRFQRGFRKSFEADLEQDPRYAEAWGAYEVLAYGDPRRLGLDAGQLEDGLRVAFEELQRRRCTAFDRWYAEVVEGLEIDREGWPIRPEDGEDQYTAPGPVAAALDVAARGRAHGGSPSRAELRRRWSAQLRAERGEDWWRANRRYLANQWRELLKLGLF